MTPLAVTMLVIGTTLFMLSLIIMTQRYKTTNTKIVGTVGVLASMICIAVAAKDTKVSKQLVLERNENWKPSGIVFCGNSPSPILEMNLEHRIIKFYNNKGDTAIITFKDSVKYEGPLPVNESAKAFFEAMRTFFKENEPCKVQCQN